MTEAFLLAMQAGGMIIDWIGNKNQVETGRMGTQLQQAGIDANLEMTRLSASQDSLDAMKQLRQNLGSQAVMYAARGTRGNPLSTLNSVSNFNSDERTRRMNLLGREAQLRAGKVLTGLHQLTSETQLGQSMTSRFLKNLPSNPKSWSAIGKGFGLTEIG